ncbi:restriction endonuclease subunit S [Lelliottia aquatilis]|uniref:restriction endonuclease subunit S n=1 Tax=Lelliottia aquatilis TaxID=2080838 RepID=UPI000CDE6764|nr:restriction endonuclease subunit S [Lelliottia aquatilis]POZ16500.1 restriction endonuclease subunit S [Lelliottia aquatilis]
MSGGGLPEGWVISSLEKVVDILDSMRVPVNNTERSTRIAGKSDNELYSYYGATGEVGKIDSYIFDEELIALGEDGVPFLDNKKNKAYLLQGKTWVNNHAHVLKAIESLSQTKFILHFLNQFDYQGYVNGGTRLKLTQANMRRMPICIPSYQEQIIIAEKLDTLLAQVDNTKTRLEQIPIILKRFRQAALNAAMRGKLTEHFNQNGKKDVCLDEIALIIDPHPSHRTPKIHENGIPYIGIGDINPQGEIDFCNARKVSPEILHEHMGRYTLNEGDFIFGKIGTLGKACTLPVGEEYTLSANVILIQPFKDKVHPSFLKYFLSSPLIMQNISQQANSTSQAAFGIKKMRAFKCNLPSLPEQLEIVRRVEQLFALADTIEKQVNAALDRVNHLTQSILAKAFRGDLTAKWRAENPDLISGENSAAALLEKIKAERAAAGGNKTSRKNV